MNWDDRVRRARQADLADWLRQNDEPLKRAGHWWYIEGCDSLRIQGNKWYRYSQGCGGNSIDFLVEYYGLSPKQAIDMLTQDAGCSPPKEKGGVKEKNINTQSAMKPPSGFDVDAIVPARDQRRVLAYLIKTRGISADIVLTEIKNGQLFQESLTGNAVFAMTNEAGNIVGAEVVGTLSNISFKGIKAGSARGFGYGVGHKPDPRYILFFESAVDLLSFITIRRSRAKSLTACLLVSMAGLKFGVVQRTLRAFGNQTSTPVLCVDNDDAGKKFIARCLTQIPTAIIKQPDDNYMDWNDQLRGKSIDPI